MRGSVRPWMRGSEDIDETRARVDPDSEMERLLQRGIRPIHLRSEDYPQQLAESPDAPAVYLTSAAVICCGDMLPADNNSVAIVGTRNATEYGEHMASLLSSELAS